jgi:hypothetical protein
MSQNGTAACTGARQRLAWIGAVFVRGCDRLIEGETKQGECPQKKMTKVIPGWTDEMVASSRPARKPRRIRHGEEDAGMKRTQEESGKESYYVAWSFEQSFGDLCREQFK